MKQLILAPVLGALMIGSGPALAQQVALNGRPVIEAAQQLKSGEFLWAPELSPEGPGLVIVNLETQRAVLFRNGVPIAASTVSTGSKGHETPTGVFTILQKNAKHFSSTYNNAPMPNMQRLTWKGIALHAGKLPGYPASHGCIRLPHKFSELLFGATKLGMTVVITSIPAVPHDSATPGIMEASPESTQQLANAGFQWHPSRSSGGLVSVVISAADQRAIVMQDGAEIGSAPVRVDGPLDGGMAYVLEASDNEEIRWKKLQFSGTGGGMEVGEGEGQRFDAPLAFRRDLKTLLRPGSVIIVTPESLKAGSPGSPLDVIKEEGSGG
ncbi:L,D-transpeptidase family protein [Sphingomonas sp. RG327]|jgi:hypothetical protein|uniref:L,D-transpeptidase family protein n=1 Tax=Sphingomonas anseongensis TaxID=2908207 RepID=A0ABT0RH59_9SPHN|nr:L,D-transpeptidase family protein [Sphingomonas anseongensis]MCL6679608.1 L,D-transpeptidase family protein [Sphingomonas anseongensis]